jgi:hypothetical protein
MGYGYQTVYADHAFLAAAGYEKVARFPCIFDSRPGYHRLGSQFLIDRGLGLWNPGTRGKQISPIPPSSKSLKNYANRLCNFLEWCEVRELDLICIDYSQDIIGRYQTEMLKGVWSRDNRPLSPRTINVRVEAAIDFVTWMADKGLRAQLSVPKVIRAYPAGDTISPFWHQTKQVEARLGKIKPSKRRILLPSNSAISAWYEKLASRPVRGVTEALIAELIIETAIRREEAACWRVDTLPMNPEEWRVLNPQADKRHQSILVELRYGTKGKEYGRDHGDKIGPAGVIRIPLLLAEKLDEYRKFDRAKALSIAVRKGRTTEEQRRIRDETVHLFLSPLTGYRYTGDNIYEFWRSVERPNGWSPHRGRDYWACTILWRRLEMHRKLLESALNADVDEVVLQAIQNNALSVIQLEIQPQLRHSSKETSIIYLQWLFDRLGINLNLHETWTEEMGEAWLDDV